MLRKKATTSCAIVLYTISLASARANGSDAAIGLAGAFLGAALAAQAAQAAQRARAPVYYYQRRRYMHVTRRQVPTEASRREAPEVVVRTNDPKVLTAYYNCRGPIHPIIGRAKLGTITFSRSTRFVCGNPDQPVLQMIYQSPKDFEGKDSINAFEKGRQVSSYNVVVSASGEREMSRFQTRTGVTTAK